MIERPERVDGPRNKQEDNATPVAAILSDKKKKLDPKKKSTAADTKTAPAKGKKQPAAKKKTAAKKKAPAKPKAPKTEAEWIAHIEKMKLVDLVTFLESKAGQSNVTALSVVRNKIDALMKLTAPLPSDYNGWLEYFSSMTNSETETFIEEHVLTLDNEAVAAGKRWLLIHENPVLIDRFVTSRLQQEKSEEVGNILTAAKSGDRVKTFEALRDNLAYKLQDGSGARDMTVLIKQLNEVMVTLDELYRETGQKDDKNSSIRKLLVRSRRMASRPKARQAATTIAEAEAEDDDEDLE